MNLFNSPAMVYWQINIEGNDNYLSEEYYLMVADQILECRPLVVILVDRIGNLNEDILFKIVKKLKGANILLKYEINAQNFEKISDNLYEFVEVNFIVNSNMDESFWNILSKIKKSYRLKFVLTPDLILNIEKYIFEILKIDQLIGVSFFQENFSYNIRSTSIHQLMFLLTEPEERCNEKVKITYKDYESEIKNLSKNTKVQFDITIRPNGDIALHLVLNIIAGNVKSSTLCEVWNSYVKDFWFRRKIKNLFIEFQSLSEEKFIDYVDSGKQHQLMELMEGS